MRETVNRGRVLDENYCRMRCTTGSENGICPCDNAKDCPDPPRITPMRLRLLHFIDQWTARIKSQNEELPMYKNLLNMIHHIAADNDLQVIGEDPTWFKDQSHWPPLKQSTLEWLDWEASRIKPKEVVTFCTGEETEQKKIADKYQCHDLSDFLEKAFDGEYFEYFYSHGGKDLRCLNEERSNKKDDR